MSERVYPLNGHIVHEVDGVIIWSTALAPCNLLPTSIVKDEFEIAWPDPPKGNVYGFDRATVGGQDTGYCSTYITMLPHEYVSDPINLGTVPSGVNYLHITVNMRRTKAPTKFFDTDVPCLLAEWETQLLDGGSCLVESFANFRRGFDITLDGTNVNLRLRQSATDAGSLFSFLSGNNPGDQPPYVGWTWEHGSAGYPVTKRDSNLSRSNPRSVNRWQSNACYTADNTDFSSVIKGKITITPGIVSL